jgi:hypothetical protein
MKSTSEIFPHRTESHLKLVVESIQVDRNDGGPREVARQIRIGNRPEYALYLESETGVWGNAVVRLRVDVGADRLPQLVAEGDDPHDQLAVLVAVRCAAARSRNGVRLTKREADFWEGEFSVERAAARGAIELVPMIVRSRDAIDAAKHSGAGHRVAAFEGAIVGTGEVVVLHVDKPDISPFDGPIKIVWVDFRKDANFIGFEDDIFRLEFVGDSPTLSLNKGDERLYEVVSYKGHGTPIAAVRDAMLASIALTCWNNLAVAALAHAAEARRSADGDALDALRDWERATLRKVFSSIVFASKDLDATIDSAIDEFEDPQRLPALLERISASVQRDQRFSAVVKRALATATKEPT